MRLIISTVVQKPLEQVFAGFDKKLFTLLNPPFPFPKAHVLRFDGCEKGHEVHLELSFHGLGTQRWESLITASERTPTRIFFIDEGIKLPFFLKKWKHQHILERNPDGTTLITDDISYDAAAWLPNFLLYPALYLQFAYRKPVYRKVFA
jgi:ligand-binding SRPBCC domain-containing protein